MVVGIAGGTASGKSTLSRGLAQALGDEAVLLLHDRYYRQPPPGADAARWNYDHPDALETELLADHLDALRAGETVDVPRYDFARHGRAEGFDRLEPRAVLLVEGILVLADPRLRHRMDLRFFVDAPADVRLIRRMRRDVVDRGRAPLGVLDQYEATVRPMHLEFVEPSRHYAHEVLDGTESVDQLVEKVLRRLGPG